MVDPHLMLLLMQLLGDEYFVWDKAADIEFIKASKMKITSIIKVANVDLDNIQTHTANGEKYFPKLIVKKQLMLSVID